MLILAINTASSKTAIALLESGVFADAKTNLLATHSAVKIIAEDSWMSENREAEKLMPAIHNLLGSPPKAGLANKMSDQRSDTLNYTDIGEIYVVKGPGSFTGLRVGVTVANTLAYLLGCKLYGITTFEYWHTAQPYPVLIYAGSGGLYFSKITGASPSLLQLSETEQVLKSKKIKTVCGDITEDQKKQLKGIKFINNKKSFGEIIKTAIESLNEKPVKMIEPIYIKSPGITRNFAKQNTTSYKKQL